MGGWIAYFFAAFRLSYLAAWRHRLVQNFALVSDALKAVPHQTQVTVRSGRMARSAAPGVVITATRLRATTTGTRPAAGTMAMRSARQQRHGASSNSHNFPVPVPTGRTRTDIPLLCRKAFLPSQTTRRPAEFLGMARSDSSRQKTRRNPDCNSWTGRGRAPRQRLRQTQTNNHSFRFPYPPLRGVVSFRYKPEPLLLLLS